MAEEEEKPSDDATLFGYCLYFYTYSTWEGRSVYMEDIYVSPEQRGRGAGMKMWRRLVQVGALSVISGLGCSSSSNNNNNNNKYNSSSNSSNNKTTITATATAIQ